MAVRGYRVADVFARFQVRGVREEINRVNRELKNGRLEKLEAGFSIGGAKSAARIAAEEAQAELKTRHLEETLTIKGGLASLKAEHARLQAIANTETIEETLRLKVDDAASRSRIQALREQDAVSKSVYDEENRRILNNRNQDLAATAASRRAHLEASQARHAQAEQEKADSNRIINMSRERTAAVREESARTTTDINIIRRARAQSSAEHTKFMEDERRIDLFRRRERQAARDEELSGLRKLREEKQKAKEIEGRFAAVGGALEGLGNFAASAGRITAIGTAALGAIPALGGLVVAAGAAATAIGLMSGALVAAPAALAGFGLGIGALALGLHGLGDALSAGSKAMDDQRQNAAQYAQSAVQAAQAVRNAQDNLVLSQHDYDNAIIQSRKNVEQYNRQLKDMQLTIKGAALDVAGAEENLRQVLANNGTPLEVAQAKQALEEARAKKSNAEDDYRQLKKDRDRAQYESTFAQMRAALQLRQAQDAVTNSLAAQKQATIQQSSAQKEYNAALEKLAPNARGVVTTLLSLRGDLDDLVKEVQQRLFAGMPDRIKKAVKEWKPILIRGFGDLAGGFNEGIMMMFDELDKPQNQQVIERLFKGSAGFLREANKSIEPFTDAILRLLDTGAKYLPDFGRFLTGLVTDFDDLIKRAQADGSLDQFILDAIDGFKLFKDIWTAVKPVIFALLKGFKDFFIAAWPGAKKALESLGKALELINWTEIGKAFGYMLEKLAPILPDLAIFISTTLPVMLRQIGDLGSDLLPTVRDVLKWFEDHPKVILPLVAGITALSLIPWGTITGGIGSIVGFLAANPEIAGPIIGIAAAALAAVAGIAALSYIVATNWPQIKAQFEGDGPFSGIGDSARRTWDQVKDTFSAVQPFFDALTTDLQDVWDIFGDGIVQKIDGIGTGLLDAINGMFEIMEGAFDLGTAILKGDWHGMWHALGEITTGQGNVLIGLLESILNVVIGGLNARIDGINWMIRQFPDFIPDSWKKQIPHIPNVDLPSLQMPWEPPRENDMMAPLGKPKYLAEGGIALGPQFAVIGDNRSARELVQPLDGNSMSPGDIASQQRDRAMMQALANMQGAGDTYNIDVTVTGSDVKPREVGEAVAESIFDKKARQGFNNGVRPKIVYGS